MKKLQEDFMNLFRQLDLTLEVTLNGGAIVAKCYQKTLFSSFNVNKGMFSNFNVNKGMFSSFNVNKGMFSSLNVNKDKTVS
jgi:hypothetical protein